MKIKEVTREHILFDNGNKIEYEMYDSPVCYVDNYADFEQIEDMAYTTDFPENLVFEKVSGFGFRFGGAGTYMFFVPCYSEQLGYYCYEVRIIYNGKPVLEDVECVEPDDNEGDEE